MISDQPPEPVSVTGYCEPWSRRAGEEVTLFASSSNPNPTLTPTEADLSITRISCGDSTRSGPGFTEFEVTTPAPDRVTLDHQPIRPGSSATVDLNGLSVTRAIDVRFSLLLTRPAEPQTVLTLRGDSLMMQISIAGGELRARASGLDLLLRHRPMANRRWYDIAVICDLERGVLRGRCTTAPTSSPGRDLLEQVDDPEPIDRPEHTAGETGGAWIQAAVSLTPSPLDTLVLGGNTSGGDLDGRIARPTLRIDDVALSWDLSQAMDGPDMVETSEFGRHGILHQLPARAVTGPDWDGSHQRWTDSPEQWDAVHFHKDDLYDAGWAATTTVRLPIDLPSGIYAFRLNTGADENRIPFFVRPAVGAVTADVGLLMSSATYLAYANHRMLAEGAEFIRSRSRLRPEHEYIRRHPEIGRSLYEKHPDGSGVMFSSRRRPVLNLRPGADGWNFTPDTDINAFLEHHLRPRNARHDVLTDEDVHTEGLDALSGYRVIVTSSHPEYWSTQMLDALAAWQRAGGRLMYLGGNGFYWRVAFSDRWPGAMELRRAEDGVRNWQTGPGESYHAFTGEYGGLWRRLGRAPNELVGVGFTAQGFEHASYYDVEETSRTGRTAWIWDGVEIVDGRIGTSGLGGGAAGQEVDRYDTDLGSPPHAVILASATDFGPDMIRTKEEFDATVISPSPDPLVRSDIVFYETPHGGAVFSVGSISWFGALARNGYDNDIARMTGNVLERFRDPKPFEPPPTGRPA